MSHTDLDCLEKERKHLCGVIVDVIVGVIVGVIVHRVICKRYRFSNTAKWYEHTPEKVLESDNVQILWDFSVQTSCKLEHNKPGISIVDRQTGECHTIDAAHSFNTRVKKKEQEKVKQYHKLKIEIKRLWQCKKVVVIPIIIEALGTISKGFRTWIRKIQMEDNYDSMQKVWLLGTAKIIRKVLDT